MVTTTSATSRSLIAASKVRGTSVYNANSDLLGTIDDIMIDDGTKCREISASGVEIGLGRGVC